MEKKPFLVTYARHSILSRRRTETVRYYPDFATAQSQAVNDLRAIYPHAAAITVREITTAEAERRLAAELADDYRD